MTILRILLVSFLLFFPTLPMDETVGKWKLNRKIPLEGPNRCYVDALTFTTDNQFELIFKTVIDSEVMVYTYAGNVNETGDATLVLGDSIAVLKNFNSIKDRIDFRFEYGNNLGMFCTREQHPYPHKHLPHDLMGRSIE